MAKEKKDVVSNHVCNGLAPSQNTSSDNSTFEEATKEALEILFETKPETYNDFLDSFIYLNKDNVMNQLKSSAVPHIKTANSNTFYEPSTSTKPHNGNHTESIKDGNNELLHELDIGPGNITPSILLRTEGNLDVKLDNFIDDESIESDTSTSYCPSIFGENSNEDNYPEIISRLHDVNEILPGEVAEIDCISADVSIHSRCLTIRTNPPVTINKKPEDEPLHDYKENENCEVEAFHLDENFDYDNIQTTPKFGFLAKDIN